MSDIFAAVCARNHEQVRELVKRDPACVRARNDIGATPLHYAAELGDRDIVATLLDAGADINARDARFHATPAGWAIEYLRERGALLGVEIENLKQAILKGDAQLVRHYLFRLPALRDAIDVDGTPLKKYALASANSSIARLFGA